MGEGNYQANGQKNYIVRIETNPAGSMFSVDSVLMQTVARPHVI